jgi:hypothetical protein
MRWVREVGIFRGLNTLKPTQKVGFASRPLRDRGDTRHIILPSPIKIPFALAAVKGQSRWRAPALN